MHAHGRATQTTRVYRRRCLAIPSIADRGGTGRASWDRERAAALLTARPPCRRELRDRADAPRTLHARRSAACDRSRSSATRARLPPCPYASRAAGASAEPDTPPASRPPPHEDRSRAPRSRGRGGVQDNARSSPRMTTEHVGLRPAAYAVRLRKSRRSARGLRNAAMGVSAASRLRGVTWHVWHSQPRVRRRAC